MLAVVGVAAALVPASAYAATTFNCDASAVRGTVLGQPIEPVTANRGSTSCKTVSSSLTGAGLPPLLGGATLLAATSFAGPLDRVDLQRAGAQGGVSDLHVMTLPGLPIQLPAVQVPAIPPVSVPGVGSVDLTPIVRALVPGRALPALDLVGIGAAYSSAGARCSGAARRLDGASQVAGLSVLGTALPVDQAVQQTLELVGAQTIDPSSADLSALGLPPLVLATARPALQAALDALPDIQVPAALAQVSVTPGAQTRTSDTLVQQAVHVVVSVLGQPLADLVVGEARVSSAGVSCATPAAAANQLALQCTARRLVLTDVIRRGGRVRLVGAADRRYVGRRVSLVFTSTGRVVAHATVRRDGGFSATAPLPPRGVRDSNRARYQARLGGERSLRLKLVRRMTVTTVRVRGGRVTIAGTISRPLGRPARPIVVTRRVSCTRNAVVARVRPDGRGRFHVTVAAPPKLLAAVYRLGTLVRKHAGNPKLYPTFTLPRAIAL